MTFPVPVYLQTKFMLEESFDLLLDNKWALKGDEAVNFN